MPLKTWIIAGLTASAMAVAPAAALSNSAERAEIRNMEGAELVEYAARPYVQFRHDVDAVKNAMPTDAAMMRNVHNRLASHDTRALAGSWVAYAAMVAADTPAFAQEIERRVRRRGGKRSFIEEMEQNPAAIRNMQGAEEAVAAIMTFATRDAEHIRTLGDDFIASAYEMQKVPWARREIALDGMARVDSALAFAAKRQWPDHGQRQVEHSRHGTVRPALAAYETWAPDWSGAEAAVNPAARGGSIVTKALILGAHYAMDTAEQKHLAAFGTSQKSERCFSAAKMNLAQCIAATRTPYEEAFCLGQHALNDISSCVGWPAGAGASGS